MSIFDAATPAERNKKIFAAILIAVAAVAVLRLFFGGSSATSSGGIAAATATPAAAGRPPAAREEGAARTLLPIRFDRNESPSATQIGRNIFAFYVPPPKPTPAPVFAPTPTPAPPPPLILASVSPSSVYAGTGDFNVEVTGDKFTPNVRVLIDEREMPTRFISAQRLQATVSGPMISLEGQRRVTLRSPDGSLYSNLINLNVSPVPRANYDYIGLIGTVRYNDDIAVLKDKVSGKMINVTRGQVIGDRQWRVTSISDKTVELTHAQIRNVKQVLRYDNQPANDGAAGGAYPRRDNYPPPQQSPPAPAPNETNPQ